MYERLLGVVFEWSLLFVECFKFLMQQIRAACFFVSVVLLLVLSVFVSDKTMF